MEARRWLLLSSGIKGLVWGHVGCLQWSEELNMFFSALFTTLSVEMSMQVFQFLHCSTDICLYCKLLDKIKWRSSFSGSEEPWFFWRRCFSSNVAIPMRWCLDCSAKTQTLLCSNLKTSVTDVDVFIFCFSEQAFPLSSYVELLKMKTRHCLEKQRMLCATHKISSWICYCVVL